MRKAVLVILAFAFLSACAPQETVALPATDLAPGANATATIEPTDLLESVEKDEESQQVATSGPDCLGSEINQIGQGIADSRI
jgi:hypothetical protein